jgi:hypothetical protein
MIWVVLMPEYILCVTNNNFFISHQEARVSIRLLLLQVFGALCGLEARLVSELLNSVLPLEIARDMQADLQGQVKVKYRGHSDLYGSVPVFCRF